MGPYLQEIYKKGSEQNDDVDEDFIEMARGIGACQLCKHIVVRSVDCPNCQVRYHLYCISDSRLIKRQ